MPGGTSTPERGRRYGLTIIAFIGSVFSPYYAWRGRRDRPRIIAPSTSRSTASARALGDDRARARPVLRGLADRFDRPERDALGRRGRLKFDIDEISAPWPRRLRGRVRVEAGGNKPASLQARAEGGHIWRPIAPRARVAVRSSEPEHQVERKRLFRLAILATSRSEAGFPTLDLVSCAAARRRGVFYDAERRREGPLHLSLEFDRTRNGFAAFAATAGGRACRQLAGASRGDARGRRRRSRHRRIGGYAVLFTLADRTRAPRRNGFLHARKSRSRPLRQPDGASNAAVPHAAHLRDEEIRRRRWVWRPSRIGLQGASSLPCCPEYNARNPIRSATPNANMISMPPKYFCIHSVAELFGPLQLFENIEHPQK